MLQDRPSGGATHPHEDHNGGLIYPMMQFPVGKVYMPRAVHTTRTYERLLLTIQEQGLKVTEAKAGVVIDGGSEVTMVFVGPVGDSYSNLNDFSAVLKLTYGETSSLFTGDAEYIAEWDMIDSGVDLSADVIKVDHHGSNSSTTAEFLRAAAPVIGVISVGKGNDYGHPSPSVIDRLIRLGVEVYRTDQHGSIVVNSDGTNIEVMTEKEPSQSPSPPTHKYIGNKNSKKFHHLNCSDLPAEHNRVYLYSRQEAIDGGFVPCKLCNP